MTTKRARPARPSRAPRTTGQTPGDSPAPPGHPARTDPIDTALQRAVEEAARLLHGDGAMIYLLDPATGMLRFSRDAGIRDAEARGLIRDLSLEVGVGMFGTAVARRELVVTNDYPNDPLFVHSPVADRIVETAGMQSMAVAPLLTSDDVLGALGVYSSASAEFDEAQLALLRALADHAAVTIANQRLLAQLAHRVEAQRTLADIATRITAMRDPAEVLQTVVDAARRLLDSDGAHLTVPDPEGPYLRPTVVAGGTDAATRAWMETQRFPIGGGMNGLAAQLGEAVRTDDYLADRRIPPQPDDHDTADRMGLRGMAVAPLRAPGGEVLGTLAVSYRTPRAVTDDELDLLQRLADQGAIALSNATLVKQLHESELRYRFLVERSPDIVFETDATGHFTVVSDAVTSMTGYTPGEVVGEHISKLIAPDTLSAVLTEWQALVADPSRERRVDFLMLRKDGTTLPVEARGAGLLRDGQFAGVHGSTRDISERIRLESELRQKAAELERSEERYRFLVERSPDIVYELDAQANFTFLSETAYLLTGWHPAEVIGRSLTSVVSEATIAHVKEQWSDIVASPQVERRLDFELLRRDGTAIPVEARGVAIMVDGQFAGVHGSVRDISERMRLENDLRRQTRELARLVDAQRALSGIAAQIAAIRDSGDVVQRTVDEAVRLLAAESGAIQQLTAERDRLVDIRRVTGEALDSPELDVAVPVGVGVSGRAVSSGKVTWTGDYASDTAFDHAEATDAWVARRGYRSQMSAPMVAAEGPIGVLTVYSPRPAAFDADDADLLGALADQAAIAVTNTRLYERLQSSERRYRHLVENSPDTIWSARSDGIISYISETIERLSGWKPEELIGQHFSVLVHPESGERMNEEWDRMLVETQPERVIRFSLRHRDGHPVPAETTGIAEVVDGRTVGAHGAVRDIRERERLEADLREQAAELAASQERGNLARELHDSVTQALFSMGLTQRSLELLLETDPGAARAKLVELRELQKDALAEMRTLIFELRPKSLEQDGLEQALRTHAAAVQGRTGLSVTVEADTALPERLPGDAEEALYRIAQEALHNVVKHAGASTARILLARVGGEVRLSVTDDGVGFDPAKTPRGHLGLVGMQQRAERIGAGFQVTTRPGNGTVVSVAWKLPADFADAAQDAVSAQ